MTSSHFPLHTPIRALPRALRAARILGGALLVSLAAAACGSSAATRLNTTHLASTIAQQIETQSGIATAVHCPPPPLQKVGVTFSCTVKLAVGSYAVTVVEINSKGAVRYSSSGPLAILDSATVERAIASSIHRQRHLTATVSCPSPVLQRSGISFTCRATTKRGVVRFAVTEVDDNGNVTIVDRSARLTSAHTRAAHTPHAKHESTHTSTHTSSRTSTRTAAKHKQAHPSAGAT